MEIPEVKVAVIGGSAIMGSGFPRDFDGVEIIAEEIMFDTPFGPTAPFTHASLDGTEFLFVPFHGITPEIRNTEPDSAGERVFYVLMEAGVKKIIGCALCGSTNRLLDPGDVVVPDGFVDYTTKRAQSLTRSLRARGVVGVSEGPRLESPSEIRLRYTNQGIDVVTMNLVPEVYFAREIGACYAALELVSNYGEGLVSTEWSGPEAFREFQRRWSRPSAEAILSTIKKLDYEDESCGCPSHRWPSIIQ